MPLRKRTGIALSALLLAGAVSLRAQTYALAPSVQQIYFTNNGQPLAGGWIVSCQAGTVCASASPTFPPPAFPQATYTDASGFTANTNPISLNSLGQASIWLNTALAYKFVIMDSTGAVLKTIDNVQVAAPGGGSSTSYWTLTGSTIQNNNGGGLPGAGNVQVGSNLLVGADAFLAGHLQLFSTGTSATYATISAADSMSAQVSWRWPKVDSTGKGCMQSDGAGNLSLPACTGFVYTGVLIALIPTCTVGQVAFITDATPGQNQYNCTATNTWTQNVGSSGSGANTALSNLAAVSINSALLFQTGIDIGSTVKPARNVMFSGSGTYGTNYMELTGTPTGARVFTFPDRTTTGTSVATSKGSLTNGNCVSIDADGNFIDAGGACTTGGGGGTVSSATINQVAYYAATGTTVSGSSRLTLPATGVDITGTSSGTAYAAIIRDTAAVPGINFYRSTSTKSASLSSGATAAFGFQDSTDTFRMVLLQTGNLGIATNTPTEKLHVVGNAIVTGSITVGSCVGCGGSGLGTSADTNVIFNHAGSIVSDNNINWNYSGSAGATANGGQYFSVTGVSGKAGMVLSGGAFFQATGAAAGYTAPTATSYNSFGAPTGGMAALSFTAAKYIQPGNSVGIPALTSGDSFKGGANYWDTGTSSLQMYQPNGACWFSNGGAALSIVYTSSCTSQVSMLATASGAIVVTANGSGGVVNSIDYTGIHGPGFYSSGTKFTTTGCGVGTTVGGSTAGAFVSGTTGTCTVTITLGGLTATNGWVCIGSDNTTATVMTENFYNTTQCVIKGTTTNGDLISFMAMAF